METVNDQREHCPRCSAPLRTWPDADPWCGGCEWNLDRMPVAGNVGWVWRRMLRWDGEAGFHADHALVGEADATNDRGRRRPRLAPRRTARRHHGDQGRQLSIRTSASLLASHPSPGRRHQWLAGRPREYARVTLADAANDQINVELHPYGRELRNQLENRELL